MLSWQKKPDWTSRQQRTELPLLRIQATRIDICRHQFNQVSGSAAQAGGQASEGGYVCSQVSGHAHAHLGVFAQREL